MSFTVRFLNYAGDDLLGTATVEWGEDATPLAPTPEIIAGKKFTGWNVPITHVVEDMTVRPTYVDVHTVTFYNYKGDGTLSVQEVEDGQDAKAPKEEKIAGKTFTGWDTDFTNVHSDLSVHPLYTDIYLTVRFLNKDGTDVWSTQSIRYGDNAIPPSPLKYTGFIFIGWNTAFTHITEDKTIRPVYREIPPHPTLNFYEENEDGSSGSLKKSYSMVNGCSIVQKLSGECTISVKLLTRQTEGMVTIFDRLEVEGLVFYITEMKKTISSGMCYTELNGEHISYILNDDVYKVTAYEKTGTAKDILQELLSGTPFNVGDVDVTKEVTLRVNKEATRRACIMQLIALLDAEIEYYGYTIGIKAHTGSTTPVDVMKTSLVQDISYTYNVSEDTTNYSLSLYQKGALELGDELILRFDPLGIDSESRIVGMDWNPFNYKDVSITVGQYIPTLNNSLYELINEVSDIRESTAKYTVEFGEMIGNGSFYFTRAYSDRPYFQVSVNDDSTPVVTLTRKSGSAFAAYVGATLTGVNADTVTLLVFYCTVPEVSEEEEE